MSTLNVTFKRDKETKNKIRFSTDINARVSGSVYLTKEDAGDRESITLPITVAEVAAPVAA